MDLNEINCYLSGLLDTASSVSVWMGPSYVVAEVFENDGFLAEFYGYYRLDPDVLLDTVTSFETLLKQWFGDEEKSDKKTVSALLYHMEKCFGKAEKEDDDFVLADRLSEMTQVPLPGAVEEIRTLSVLHDLVVDKEDMASAVLNALGIGS